MSYLIKQRDDASTLVPRLVPGAKVRAKDDLLGWRGERRYRIPKGTVLVGRWSFWRIAHVADPETGGEYRVDRFGLEDVK